MKTQDLAQGVLHARKYPFSFMPFSLKTGCFLESLCPQGLSWGGVQPQRHWGGWEAIPAWQPWFSRPRAGWDRSRTSSLLLQPSSRVTGEGRLGGRGNLCNLRIP